MAQAVSGNLVAAATAFERPVPAAARPEQGRLGDLCVPVAPGLDRLPMLDAVLASLPDILIARLRRGWSAALAATTAPATVLRYQDHVSALPGAHLVGLFGVSEGGEGGILDIAPETVFLMLDIALGGSGVPARSVQRAYTLIETEIMRVFCEAVLAALGEALLPVTQAAFRFDRWEREPQTLEPALEGEGVLVLSLTLASGAASGTFRLALPVSMLEPMRDRLAAVYPGEKMGDDPLWRRHLAAEIAQAPVEIEAVLFDGMVPLGRVRDIRIGDTFSFDLAPESGVSLRCGAVSLSRGRIGCAGPKVAILVDAPFAAVSGEEP